MLSFPTICSPLPSRVDANNYPHLHGLKLADYSDSEDSIDVLIGSDYHWDFVTIEIVRGDFGPTAVNSKFGWLLSGATESVINQETTVTNLTIARLVQYSQIDSSGVSGDKKGLHWYQSYDWYQWKMMSFQWFYW